MEDETKPDDIRINLPSMLSGTTISCTMNILRTIPQNRPNRKFSDLPYIACYEHQSLSSTAKHAAKSVKIITT